MKTTLEHLKEITQELRELVDDECCDHSVNICFCATFEAIREADEHVLQMEYDRADAKLIDGRPKPLVLKGHI